MFDIIETVDFWLSQNRPVAMATVTKTWGSAPRREGSKMVVSSDLAMAGSVSGGCVEGAVIEEALAGLQDKQPRLLKFGVADDTAWSVGLTCGGKIHVFVEPLDVDWWTLLEQRIKNDQLTTTITVLEGDLAGEKGVFGDELLYKTTGLTDDHIASLKQIAETTHRSGQITWQDTEIMVDVSNPRPHLIIIGGVHVAIPLQAFARQLGFRVSIIDPRQAFASPERFPEVETILHTYPDKALPQLGLDRNTYLAVLTHDPKIDDKALITALPTDVPYVGVLSSSRTHEKRTKRLQEAGLSDDVIERIHTPIGIDLGSLTPEEIALGIMAEIVAVRNGVR
ncbi:MAG: XdhC family protein [Chloroflexi bacterium]|nr:XdhC family protein [Chloroflexota bacterium]